MCGKQCRDENGFKCHLTSESHRRQMEIFGQDPQRIIDGFSEEFEAAFLEHLRRAHPFSRVSANVVYNEFIQDRHHIHMNSTCWLTLSEFVKYLGREGKCKVEDTPKGWYITLIQKDPFEELEGQRRVKRERAEKEEEERHRRALELQVARAKAASGDKDKDESEEIQHDLKPEALQQPLEFKLPAKAPSMRATSGKEIARDRKTGSRGESRIKDELEEDSFVSTGVERPHKMSKVEQVMQKELRAKSELKESKRASSAHDVRYEHQERPWLLPGIIVKVMSKALREHGYYKKKGKVLKVIDDFVGELEMMDSTDVLRVDQAELETVVPNPGGNVLLLVDKLRGRRGKLIEIDEVRYKAKIRLLDSEGNPDDTAWLEYEDFSKLAG